MPFEANAIKRVKSCVTELREVLTEGKDFLKGWYYRAMTIATPRISFLYAFRFEQFRRHG
jgi:hypothetical protein